MASFLSYGAYLPRHRVAVKELHAFFGRPGRPRSRTLATPGLDEDTLTMAYEAAAEAVADDRPRAVVALTQSPPFGLRKFSSTLCRTLGLDDAVAYDIGGHSGSLLDAFDLAALLARDGGTVLVVASDHLVSYDERAADTLSAGGAAAFLLGADGGFATLGASARTGHEVYDHWRLGLEPEPRYRLEVLFDAYAVAAKEALAALAAVDGERDYAAVCASQPHPQTLRALGRLGIDSAALEHTSFVGEIGNLGAASVGLALCLGFDRAQPGEHLLAFGYGAGEGIAQALEVTAAPPAIGAADRIAGQEIALGTYYRWTRGRQAEPH